MWSAPTATLLENTCGISSPSLPGGHRRDDQGYRLVFLVTSCRGHWCRCAGECPTVEGCSTSGT